MLQIIKFVWLFLWHLLHKTCFQKILHVRGDMHFLAYFAYIITCSIVITNCRPQWPLHPKSPWKYLHFEIWMIIFCQVLVLLSIFKYKKVKNGRVPDFESYLDVKKTQLHLPEIYVSGKWGQVIMQSYQCVINSLHVFIYHMEP